VIKLAEEHDMGDNLIYATIARDAAAAYQGNPVEGIEQMRQSIEAYRAKGSNLMMTCYLGLVADLYGMEWQVAEGLRVVDEALATAGRTGERWWEAELHRTRGKLLIKQAIAVAGALPSLDDQSPLALIDPSTLSETENCFHRAIEVARSQYAKSLELRAVTSLGRFWLLCGKKDEARAMIAEIFDWFTEGFDTADLKDAEALLDELQSQTALPQ
jgi:predicted ATPase